MIELCAWIANVLFFLAAYKLGEKKRYAWLLQALGNVGYILYAAAYGLPALGLLSLVLMCTSLRGWWKWR